MQAEGRSIGIIEFLSEYWPHQMRDDALDSLHAYKFSYSLVEVEAFGLKKDGDELVPYAFLPSKTRYPNPVILNFEERAAVIAGQNHTKVLVALEEAISEVVGETKLFSRADTERFNAILYAKACKRQKALQNNNGNSVDAKRIIEASPELLSPFDQACSNLVYAKSLWKATMEEMLQRKQPEIRYDALNKNEGIGQRKVFDIFMEDVKATSRYTKVLALG